MGRKLLAVVVVALMVSIGVHAFAAEEAAAPPAPEGEEAPPPPKPSPVAEYFKNRGKDFLDIWNLKLSLSHGLSFLVNVRATRLAQIGGGQFIGTKVGFEGPSAGILGEGRVEGGVSVCYWSWIGRKYSTAGVTEDALKTNRFFGRVDDIKATDTFREYYDANRPWYTIGGSLHLPFLPGIEAEMNPAEAVDFVLSFFGVPGLRIPLPFQKREVAGERVPHPYSLRWHGQEDFELYD